MQRTLSSLVMVSVGTSLALALQHHDDDDHHHHRHPEAGISSSSMTTTTTKTDQSSVTSSSFITSERRAGRILFNACQSCHVGIPLGPPFWREKVCLFDKPAGSVYPDYPYTNALKDSGVIWNETTLDEWLKDPATFIPGNYMSVQGMDDPTERQEMIAIMKSFCDETTSNVTNDNDDLMNVPSSSPTTAGQGGGQSSEAIESSAFVVTSGLGYWMGPVLFVTGIVMGARR